MKSPLNHLLIAILAAFAVTGMLLAADAPVPGNESKVVPPQEEKGLEFDATLKEYAAKAGEESCTFVFAVKNISKADIVINQVRTSCGCTVAKLPAQPWRLAPGAGGDIILIVDLKGKTGELI